MTAFFQVQSLNGWLKPVGIGAFHCAVQAHRTATQGAFRVCGYQVYGVEWSYGGNEAEGETGAWALEVSFGG